MLCCRARQISSIGCFVHSARRNWVGRTVREPATFHRLLSTQRFCATDPTSASDTLAGATGDEGIWDDAGIPKVVKHFNMMGEQYRSNKMYSQAERVFQIAIEELEQYGAAGDTKESILAQLLNNKGVVLSERGDFAGAEKLLLQASLRKRGLSQHGAELSLGVTLGQLGFVLYRQGKCAEAGEALGEARKLVDGALANVLADRSIIVDEEREIREFIGEDRDDVYAAVAATGLGKSVVALRELEDDERDVRIALSRVENSLGLVSFRQKDYAAAAGMFSSAAAHVSQCGVPDPVIEMNVAMCFEGQERYDDALEIYAVLKQSATDSRFDVGDSPELARRVELLQKCIARVRRKGGTSKVAKV